MKKLLGILGVSLAILIAIVGYAYYREDQRSAQYYADLAKMQTAVEESSESTEEYTTVTETYEESSEETATETDELIESTEEEYESEEEKVITIDSSTHNDMSYAYQKLNEDERAVYDVIYSTIMEYEEKVTVPTLDYDMIDKAFNCVLIDHPEIFNVNGYRYTKYTKAGELKSIAFSPSYCYSKSETEKLNKDIDAAVDNILSKVYAGATEYQKIRYIYDVIVTSTEYDLNSSDNQNVISVLINHRSVCQGYSKAMQLLLGKMGIPCTLITGTVKDGESHAWNAIKADGQWYYTDVTWGDSSYKSASAESVDYAPEVNYDYLLVTSAEMGMTHVADTLIEYPYATAIDDNYYVKEGLYITAYNPEQMKAIFDYARALGQKSVSFKCSDGIVYSQVRSELIDKQKVFDYLVVRQIRYVEDANMRKLMFALQ